MTMSISKVCEVLLKKDMFEVLDQLNDGCAICLNRNVIGCGLANEKQSREKKLTQRVQELVSTLEKLSRNSERRHQECAEFVNDLKRANSALISAFEKAKKKYQSKLKKLEVQMSAMAEKYETQLNLLKQRVAALEEEAARLPANETSL